MNCSEFSGRMRQMTSAVSFLPALARRIDEEEAASSAAAGACHCCCDPLPA